MKFGKFKNEQELMDSLNLEDKNDVSVLVDFAVKLNERYGISIDKAVTEVKRMMEAKKQGLPIETTYREEDAFDYVKPPEFTPIERDGLSDRAGTYSEHEQNCLVETHLFSLLDGLQSIDDKQIREDSVRDRLDWFCTYYGIDPSFALEKVKRVFVFSYKNPRNKYDYFLGDELNRITGIAVPEDNNPKKSKKQRGNKTKKMSSGTTQSDNDDFVDR